NYNPAPNPSLAEVAPLEKLPFDLQSGEKIIRELKPQFLGFMVSRAFGGYLGILVLIIFIIAAGIVVFSGVLAGVLSAILLIEVSKDLLIGIAIVPLTILVIISIKPFISYGKSWYWITNNRVIGKRGFLGYSIDSIPLENVSDIVLSRTLLDRLLGLSSLTIVPMGGTNSGMEGDTTDEKFRNTNFFPALPQNTARELQRVLFNLREDLRKSRVAQSAFSASASGSSEVAQPKSDFPRGTT
ncbi:MAG: PH domain-containing protein, partial [Candidatus Micrarchaeales archaeon]